MRSFAYVSGVMRAKYGRTRSLKTMLTQAPGLVISLAGSRQCSPCLGPRWTASRSSRRTGRPPFLHRSTQTTQQRARSRRRSNESR